MLIKLLKRVVLFPVRLYQKFISPLSPPCCRFRPSCSQYCIEAVEEWGIVCGIGLAIWRVLRCNPWSRGGDDPVPPNKRKRNKQSRKK